MKKKFISLMLCVFCMLSFIGCGQTANDAAAPTAEPQATETVQETAAAQETPAAWDRAGAASHRRAAKARKRKNVCIAVSSGGTARSTAW